MCLGLKEDEQKQGVVAPQPAQTVHGALPRTPAVGARSECSSGKQVPALGSLPRDARCGGGRSTGSPLPQLYRNPTGIGDTWGCMQVYVHPLRLAEHPLLTTTTPLQS